VIALQSDRKAWSIVTAGLVVIILVAVLGQFFLWSGVDVWRQDALSFVLGSIVIVCSVVAAISGLRLVARGRIDLPGALQGRLAKRFVRRRLALIEPEEHRDLVRQVLDEQSRGASG
jgi:hypothetical protein